MKHVFELPLELWIDKIFPLLESQDYLSIITTSKNKYKYFTNSPAVARNETWKVFYNKEIREITEYMKKSYEDMISFYEFKVSAEEWEILVDQTIFKRFGVQKKKDFRTEKLPFIEKLLSLSSTFFSNEKNNSLIFGNSSLLYDSLFVFLSFADPAFYPIKYEADLVMQSSAQAIKARSDFEYTNVKTTVGQILEYFKILVSVYEQHNLYFKQRTRYARSSQCISFYRLLLNYCSPFDSLDQLKKENFIAFAVYMLSFAEKTLSLIYEKHFKKVANLRYFKNHNNTFTLVFTFEIFDRPYEIFVDEFEWSVKEVSRLYIQPNIFNFFTSNLFSKFLFNSFVPTEATINQIKRSKVPNPDFLECKELFDLEDEKIKLYCHYTKYGCYAFSSNEACKLLVTNYTPILVEKVCVKKKDNSIKQKYFLIETADENKNLLFPAEIGTVGQMDLISCHTLKSDYVTCYSREQLSSHVIQLLPMNGYTKNFNHVTTLNEYFKLYLAYGYDF